MKVKMSVLAMALAMVTGCATTTKKPVEFSDLFVNDKPVIAAIMLEGKLETEEEKRKMIDLALSQLDILEREGVDAALYEFRGGGLMSPKVKPEVLQRMVDVTKAIIREAKTVVIGVEILWHYPEETLLLAKRSGAKFVRQDFFSDRMTAGKKKTEVPIDPEGLLQFRKQIGAEDVALWTDIQVKYAHMVDKSISLTDSAVRARKKGSNGLIVTGTKSGTPPSALDVKLGKDGSGKLKVIIGSGFSIKNARELMEYADAAIVGTSISTKTGGVLVPEKVRELMTIVKDIRAKKAATSIVH